MLMYSTDATADRAFLRDVLEFGYVEDHPGWLIFKLPPAEVGVHPTDGAPKHELYLMCDDVEATVAELTARGVPVTGPRDLDFGILATITLPSGATLDVYQPKHRLAIEP